MKLTKGEKNLLRAAEWHERRDRICEVFGVKIYGHGDDWRIHPFDKPFCWESPEEIVVYLEKELMLYRLWSHPDLANDPMNPIKYMLKPINTPTP